MQLYSVLIVFVQIILIKINSMNKKITKYGLWFYLITMELSFLFPKLIFGNIVIICIYLVVCLTLLYFMFFWKAKNVDNNINKN